VVHDTEAGGFILFQINFPTLLELNLFTYFHLKYEEFPHEMVLGEISVSHMATSL
jgi:hypothetical protein